MADYSSDSSYSDSSEEETLQKKPKLVRAKKTPEPAPPPEEPEVKPKRKYVKKVKTEEEAAAIKAKRIEILAKAREARKVNQAKKKEDLNELKEIKEKPLKEKKVKKEKATIVNNYYYSNETPTNSPTAAPSSKKDKPVKPAKKEKANRPAPVETKKILFV